MENDIKKMFGRIQKDSLSLREKEAMKREILLFMDAHPITPASRVLFWRTVQTLFSPQSASGFRMAPALLSLIVVLGSGSLAAYAAQGSLPGQTLYTIKTNINERFYGATRTSAEAKVAWQTDLVERRLEEAETLIAKGEWSAHTRLTVEANLEKHSSEAKNRISAIEATGKPETAEEQTGHLEVTLKTHEKILAALLDEKSKEAPEIKPFLEKLAEKAENTAEIRVNLEQKILAADTTPEQKPVEKKVRTTKKELVNTKTLVKEKQSSLNAKTTANTEARLMVAEELFERGEKALDEGRLKDAYQNSKEAGRIVEETRLLLKADQNLKIGISADPYPAAAIMMEFKTNATSSPSASSSTPPSVNPTPERSK